MPSIQRRGRETVTMIVSHFAPAYGLETVALSTIELLKQDFDTTTVCIGGGQQDRDLSPNCIVLGTPLRGLKRILSIWRLWNYARSDKNDHIVLAGVWVALPWLLVAGKKRNRSVVWEHTLLESKFPTSKKLRLLAAAAKFLYPRARKVIAVSEPLHRDILKIAPKAVSDVIHNPIVRRPGGLSGHRRGQSTKYRVITVGSLSSLKSQDLIIRALPLLDNDVLLSIIGAGPRHNYLVELAETLNVSSRVEFEGFLSPSDVQQRMFEANILVHCSIAETFGMVYIEAAEADLPVLSTRNDVAELFIPEYVPGWVCEPTPEAIASAIQMGRKQPDSPEVRSAAEAKRVAAFGPNAVRRRWIDSLVGDRARGGSSAVSLDRLS